MAIEFGRIEDVITLAREGKDVSAEVELRKQVVTQKVHPGDTGDMKSEVDAYLLIGAYAFWVGKEVRQVSKVYVYGFLEEPRRPPRHDPLEVARLDARFVSVRHGGI